MATPLRSKLRERPVCINGWSLLPTAAAAELLARCGFDSITLDMQHGFHDYASVVACLQAMHAYDVTPLVRVPWNEPAILGRVLDAGAWGIICPMINTARDASALTSACLYPPVGQRSNGPVRAALYGGSTAYQNTANQTIVLLPQIETREAVANIEGILDVEGVGGIYVGPSDMALSLGLSPDLDREEPEILALYGRLVEATARRGLVAGIHNASPDYARRMIGLGFTLVTVASDGGLLSGGAIKAIERARDTGARGNPGG